MADSRIAELAHNLITYSVRLQPGEKVLIEAIGPVDALAAALIREAYQAGGYPFLTIKKPALNRELYLGTSEEHMRAAAVWEAARMKEMQAYIGLRGADNASELADVPDEKSRIYQSCFWRPVHSEIRVPYTKWCVLRYPTPSMAQLAGMSTEAFADFYFRVCNLDYSKMSRAMDALVALMQRTDRVKIDGPGVDLNFSIKGIPAIKCAGEANIPDGEVYTAPVRDSVNGIITYNTPSPYQGFKFENVHLELKEGRIINATANDSVRLNRILDTDEGARFVGEFALGVNPYIDKPMGDTLFDEKIKGSFHFTPGASYDEAFNGNRSAVHWDQVVIQRPEYGGGEIYFDGTLVRKDGHFVLPELAALNPENLV